MKVYAILNEENRIIAYTPQLADDGSENVQDEGSVLIELTDEIANGNFDDYLFENGELVYDPAESAIIGARNGISERELINMILDSVTIPEKPAEKIGYITVPHYDHAGNAVVWTFEADPDYTPETSGDGTAFNPYVYTVGMTVEAGKWYADGEYIWEAIKDGVPSGFDDKEYFDIIDE